MKDFELLIYNTPTEDVKVNVVLKDETIWETQKAMAALFGVQVAAISKHVKHIFDSSFIAWLSSCPGREHFCVLIISAL